MTANPNCPSKEEAERAVNEVWDSCWSDTRPFDEVSARYRHAQNCNILRFVAQNGAACEQEFERLIKFHEFGKSRFTLDRRRDRFIPRNCEIGVPELFVF